MFFPNFFAFGTQKKAPPDPQNDKSSKNAESPPTAGSAAHPFHSITGKFDPTSLERGAKALREIDASPNAIKAFDALQLSELTKQTEAQKDSEKFKAISSKAELEKGRQNADEKRKTLSHQQEQERITVQYKAQIEAELYERKLSEQQKQNEEWLAQQHSQFLRQEEQRLQNERRLLDLKREQIREEKSLEREITKERIREEATGRIRQERENIDVELRRLKLSASEKRQTQLQLLQESVASFGGLLTTLADDKKRLLTAIGSVSGVALGIYGSRSTSHVVGKYIESKIGCPPLVRDTSRWVLSRSAILSSVFFPVTWASRLFRRRKVFTFQESIVLDDELNERLQWTTNSLLSAKRNCTPYRHLLLYGPPGTGKTLFARTLAKASGLDYAIISGGDVGPLGKHGVTEIHKLFNWAKKSKRGTILFIDEADAFLRQGRAVVAGSVRGGYGLSEELRMVLSAFLHHTGTESDKFCVVLATNVREVLDPAVLDRIDEHFEFPLPGKTERRRMLTMFLNEYIYSSSKQGRKIIVDETLDDSYWQSVASRTEGFSGRQLAKLVISLQAAVYGGGANILTKGVAETVVKWKIFHFLDDVDTLNRNKRKLTLRSVTTS